jgi:N-methylhydantoinase B
MVSVQSAALVARKVAGRSAGAVDAVTARVIRSAMETICFEMAVYVSRTAMSPILNQSNERNATILDASGRLAALSVGIPQLMLQSTLPVRFALDFFGRDGFHEGDVFLSNDPYHGAGHLPDYNVYAPCFAEGRFVAFASIQCHHADTGGSVPGGYNVTVDEVWGEGTRWPAVKVVDRGEEREGILYALQANNRVSAFGGDIRAQIGAARLGVRRLGEVIERYGADTVEAAVQWNIDYSAHRFAEEVASWPDGIYEADVYVDHDPRGNPDIHIHLVATVQGDRLHLDFSGTDSRPELQAWSSYGNTRGYAVAALAALMDSSIPKNEGFFDSVSLYVPDGCVLNPPPGKAVSAGTHHPGIEVGQAIAMALSKVRPERCAPQVYKTGIPTTIVGHHPGSAERFIDNSAEVYAG